MRSSDWSSDVCSSDLGVSREQIEAGIQDWAASPMTAASMIPGFVHKAANRPTAPSDGGIGKATKKAMGWADMGNTLAQRQAEGLNPSTPKRTEERRLGKESVRTGENGGEPNN